MELPLFRALLSNHTHFLQKILMDHRNTPGIFKQLPQTRIQVSAAAVHFAKIVRFDALRNGQVCEGFQDGWLSLNRAWIHAHQLAQEIRRRSVC